MRFTPGSDYFTPPSQWLCFLLEFALSVNVLDYLQPQQGLLYSQKTSFTIYTIRGTVLVIQRTEGPPWIPVNNSKNNSKGWVCCREGSVKSWSHLKSSLRTLGSNSRNALYCIFLTAPSAVWSSVLRRHQMCIFQEILQVLNSVSCRISWISARCLEQAWLCCPFLLPTFTHSQ